MTKTPNYLTLGLATAGLILLTYHNCKTKKELTFEGIHNTQYQLNAQYADLNGDRRIDALVINYDLNKDGKQDAAIYLINPNGSVYNYAKRLIIDEDYNGTPDVVYTDFDNNKTLEHIIHLNKHLPDNKTTPPRGIKIKKEE